MFRRRKYKLEENGDLVTMIVLNLGYFSLSELKSVKEPLGLPIIERDLHFDLKSLQELLDTRRGERGEWMKISEPIFWFCLDTNRIFENFHPPRQLNYK